MNLARKFSFKLPANSVKPKTISLQNKEFQLVDLPSNKNSPLPKPGKTLKNISLNLKTLTRSPVPLSSFNTSESRYSPYIKTPTPVRMPLAMGRRSSVCLKMNLNENKDRHSGFGSGDESETLRSKQGVSEMFSINGNLHFLNVDRNRSPIPMILATERQIKKKGKFKKVKSDSKIRVQEAKIPKFALDIKKVACEVKSSKKKRLLIP